MLRATTFCVAAVLVCTATGCSRKNSIDRVETFEVRGKVMVDGEAAEGVSVRCHPVDGMNEESPTTSAAISGPDGVFVISTYETGDGLPTGEYYLTFEWRDLNMVTMTYSGPDKLNERYSDAESSPFKVDVKDGEIDMGTIELTSR